MRATIVALSRNKSLENNNQENTPTRPRPPRPPLRPPLLSRDHNAMIRNAPLTAKSGNAANNMPSSDKHSRPLMPTLSAAAKASNRAPLTPRVAGSAAPTASTPIARRGTRSDNNTPPLGSSRDDLSNQVSTFLNHNVTPRSGARKSRVDSTHSTPTGTPNGTPVLLSTNESLRIAGDAPVYTSGLGIAGIDKDIPKRPTVSFSPVESDVGYSKPPSQPTTADSKFFFASDAKSIQAPKPPPPAKSTSNFFYANGDVIPPPLQSSGTSAAGSTVGEERPHPKFFHANGTPDRQASPSPHFPPPRPSSTVSTNSRITSPPLGTASPGPLSPPQRPVSPQKLNQPPSMPSLRSAPLLPSPLVPRPLPQGPRQSANNSAAARRASIENGQRFTSHSRPSSIGSPDSITGTQRIPSSSSVDGLVSAAPLNQITASVLVSTPEEIPEAFEPDGEDVPPEVQSPTRAGHSIEQMNEFAANARRERKVLDLEITNSSLAAINRTLEREMRKQTAELRRYRRLSRSGRLSIATSTSVRTSSGSLSIMEGVEGSQLSDMSEEDSEEDSEEESSEEESVDDGSLSPGAIAENDLRHRKKDEKRLQLDLSKHRQLLIDSQKMNQSLKRCLGWTEELINEGKKALEYHVRVSDVELGGRVLVPDEIEGDDHEGLGEITAAMLKEARMAAVNGTAAWSGEGTDDRDSAIELDGGAQRGQVGGLFQTLSN